jgi:hypothetical protein
MRSALRRDKPNEQVVTPSRFLLDVAEGLPDYVDEMRLSAEPAHQVRFEDLLAITFSELASFDSCGLALDFVT